jgi:hypothetical protein
VIRGVVIHLMNEQPLLADVEALPAPSDVAFVCTNLRTMEGKRPIFVDRMESTFVFPYSQIRFIEVPDPAGVGKQPTSQGEPRDARRDVVQEPAAAPPQPEPELEIDEDFLRRIREI